MGSHDVLFASELRHQIRLRSLRYLTTFIAPTWALCGFLFGGAWAWALPLHAFLLVPVLELFLHGGLKTMSKEEEATALADPMFDLILYLIVPMQWALLLLFLYTVGRPDLEPWEVAGHIASMGVLCGIYGINVAHELGHRAKRWERDLARALLLTSLYMHFIIEHNRGHHRRVATSEDPASARYGEMVYAFWLRSIIFSFLSAWRIELERVRNAGLPAWSRRNEMLQGMAWQLALLCAIGAVFGAFVLGAFLGAALIGILLLETVNYIEHYGLRRRRSEQGAYVRVQHVHSWNSDHLLGRLTLFELTRHSDHHWKASKKYQVLQSLEHAPQLPYGYPAMMLISLLPPLFFHLMHPRLDALARAHADLELAA